MAKKTFHKKKTIPFRFGSKHIDYIRKCAENTYNIAEGAVRAGKTVDNVYAFAHELETTPDKIHLATGSTAANAKLNIGDCNGMGLEYIFRGQCRWGKYKGNDCLIINGPKTRNKQRVVIFAGASLANSFKKIRGNSYGMWIATEINLHHDNTIKEAFNRTLASHRRKFFWDLNPDNPKAKIYTEYIDKYRKRAQSGELAGGVNYEHFTIFDNINISEQQREDIISQYDKQSIWYQRDILGIRCIAEGLINRKLAAEYTSQKATDKIHQITLQDSRRISYQKIAVGVDFGGNGSGHAFVATGIERPNKRIVALASSRIVDENDDIDPNQLAKYIVDFVIDIYRTYGKVTEVCCDSAEPVLIRGVKSAFSEAGFGELNIRNAKKDVINNRILAFCALFAQDRFNYVEGKCDTLLEALATAVWDETQLKKVRLDNGTTDIDSLDAFEYSWERDIKSLLPLVKLSTEEDE